MKTRIFHFITVTVLALLAVGNLAPAATITWTNTSGGNWSVAANWSPNQVPTNTDSVLITAPGTYTVNFDLISSGYSPSASITNLTRSEEHTSELQSPCNLVCRLLLE